MSKKPLSIRLPESAQIRAKAVIYAPRILIAVGIVLLITAGVVGGYGFFDDYLAGQRAKTVLKQMREDALVPVPSLPALAVSKHTETDETDVIIEISETAETGESVVSTLSPPIQSELVNETTESPVLTPGMRYEAIGVLTIPKLKLELPVLTEYSESMLNISICKYDGEVLDKPERLIVAGHNYKSHFGKLPGLEAGDEVCFSTTAGVTYIYSVIEITDISMYDHETLEQGEWDITLFTCDSDPGRRVLIRCRENQ